MPHTPEESNKDQDHRRGSTASIAAWWNKFHFSGRVIMCSVLFGLGLVLIGGLVFAINMDDGNINKDVSEPLPAKAPSKYVGPVIMGIGGFIVIVGIIMCLFETQVCRKKSGDSSPLISDRADPEGKDSLQIPSSSRSHKNHKRGKLSPRKSKNKHAKSHLKEKGHQKSPSAKSPPMSIDQSKSFMTSSEDKFLTPPNVPSTFEENSSKTAEHPTPSSVMKSFTSSGPSWNQSAEFLTPSTSFRDTSVSLESSIEVNEKQEQVNFKTSEIEYMTPLTVEEDRIQKLLIRVRNEQQEQAKREMEEKLAEMKDNARSETGAAYSPNLQTENAKKDIKSIENPENKNISIGAVPLNGTSGLNQSQSSKLENNDGLYENEKNHKENASSDKSSINKVNEENLIENNEVQKSSHVGNVDEKGIYVQDAESLKIPSVSDASINKSKLDSSHHLNKDVTNDEANENDLENSVSSNETVISRDSFLEKQKSNESVESAMKENTLSTTESLDDAKAVEDSGSIDPPNILPEVTREAEMESNESVHKENDSKTDKHAEILPVGDSS